jgi:hypothetical protein
MFIAAAAFALLTVLLALTPSRPVLLAGAGLQVLVIAGYVAIAAERTPAFEAWGLSLKALQVALLIALVSLAFQPTSRQAARTAAPPPGPGAPPPA